MWKILIILAIVVCAQSTEDSGVKRRISRGTVISTTKRETKPESTTTTAASPTTTKEKTPISFSAETTSRIWRSTDKHRHHHGEHYASLSPTSMSSPHKTLPKEQKDVITQDEKGESKRTSRLVTIEKEPETLKKSIEIELKSHTPPPEEPAVIEVLPEPSYQNQLPNSWSYSYPHAVEEVPWQSLPYNPLQRNAYEPQVNWNSYNDPYQYRIPYVPTEELIHGQNYAINYDVNPFIYYSQAQPSSHIQADQPRFVRYDPHVLKNIIIKKSQALVPKPETENEESITNENTEATSSTQDDQQMEASNQNNLPTQWVVYPEELAKPISINTGPTLGNRPIVTKFVTRSYKLQIYPKLEWVPL